MVSYLAASAKKLSEAVSTVDPDTPNKARRELYARIGLLELDILESAEDSNNASKSEEYDQLLASLRELNSKLALRFIKLPKGIFWQLVNFVDDSVRILSTWTFMLDFCIFGTPWIMGLDWLFPGQQIAAAGRQLVCKWCLDLCGVHLDVEGNAEKSFESRCSMLAFSHASTMDAFVLGAVSKCSCYTLSKRELFAIPFFGWLLAMGGGVAIDRSNREQATAALHAAVEAGQARSAQSSAAHKGSMVNISPEGTRSKTGQLLEFKKGPFYVWEELNEDILPLIIFGAYDLYGQDKNMSTAGRVVARFLPAIKPNEVDESLPPPRRRELMSRLLRRRMLESMLNSPSNVGDEGGIAYTHRFANYAALTLCWGFNYLILLTAGQQLDKREISYGYAATAFGGATIGISIFNYFYNIGWGRRHAKKQ